jgi:hypothetical protein
MGTARGPVLLLLLLVAAVSVLLLLLVVVVVAEVSALVVVVVEMLKRSDAMAWERCRADRSLPVTKGSFETCTPNMITINDINILDYRYHNQAIKV